MGDDNIYDSCGDRVCLLFKKEENLAGHGLKRAAGIQSLLPSLISLEV
jgi:hypothetical protein